VERPAALRFAPTMIYKTVTMPAKKQIALVAHDAQKANLIEWAKFNRGTLVGHTLWGTGTTGAMLEAALGLSVHKLLSGPLGGDQQVGAMIVEGKIDLLIFFWDPLKAQPHDPDVKALLRLAAVWNIPMATNEATADFLMDCPHMNQKISVEIPDYAGYLKNRTE